MEGLEGGEGRLGSDTKGVGRRMEVGVRGCREQNGGWRWRVWGGGWR